MTLRRRLEHLYGKASDPLDHIARVDALRDRMLSVGGVGETDDFDWKTIVQADLRQLGTETHESDHYLHDQGQVCGGRVALASCARRPAPTSSPPALTSSLGDIADLALGLKTGNDDWFMVEIPDGINSKDLRARARGMTFVRG